MGLYHQKTFPTNIQIQSYAGVKVTMDVGVKFSVLVDLIRLTSSCLNLLVELPKSCTLLDSGIKERVETVSSTLKYPAFQRLSILPKVTLLLIGYILLNSPPLTVLT